MPFSEFYSAERVILKVPKGGYGLVFLPLSSGVPCTPIFWICRLPNPLLFVGVVVGVAAQCLPSCNTTGSANECGFAIWYLKDYADLNLVKHVVSRSVAPGIVKRTEHCRVFLALCCLCKFVQQFAAIHLKGSFALFKHCPDFGQVIPFAERIVMPFMRSLISCSSADGRPLSLFPAPATRCPTLGHQHTVEPFLDWLAATVSSLPLDKNVLLWRHQDHSLPH